MYVLYVCMVCLYYIPHKVDSRIFLVLFIHAYIHTYIEVLKMLKINVFQDFPSKTALPSSAASVADGKCESAWPRFFYWTRKSLCMYVCMYVIIEEHVFCFPELITLIKTACMYACMNTCGLNLHVCMYVCIYYVCVSTFNVGYFQTFCEIYFIISGTFYFWMSLPTTWTSTLWFGWKDFWKDRPYRCWLSATIGSACIHTYIHICTYIQCIHTYIHYQ